MKGNRRNELANAERSRGKLQKYMYVCTYYLLSTTFDLAQSVPFNVKKIETKMQQRQEQQQQQIIIINIIKQTIRIHKKNIRAQ